MSLGGSVSYCAHGFLSNSMNEADYRYLIAHHELGHACAVLHMRRLHGDPSYKFDWIGIGNVRGFEGGMVSGPFADPIAAALISMAGPMADARLLGRPLHRPPPPIDPREDWATAMDALGRLPSAARPSLRTIAEVARSIIDLYSGLIRAGAMRLLERGRLSFDDVLRLAEPQPPPSWRSPRFRRRATRV